MSSYRNSALVYFKPVLVAKDFGRRERDNCITIEELLSHLNP
jgi:hypothetical protein